MSEPAWDFDAIVIGTGFAGAVTACRLVQAGRRICVLERGRRYEPDDFPVYPTERPGAAESGDGESAEEHVLPDFSRLFWRMGQGLWDVRDLGDVVAAQAAGFGGGSLIYANVHLRAPAEVFEAGWPAEYRRSRLEDYYDLAAYMLNVRPLPPGLVPAKTAQLRHVAEKLGRQDAFFFPPLAVSFADGPGATPAGPEREGLALATGQGTCNLCGDCCFGCRRQAKNTLDLNYLALAEAVEREGRPLAEVRTLCEATSIGSLRKGESDGYEVRYVDHLAQRSEKRVTSRYVFLCAGSLNSTELLLRSVEGRGLDVRSDGLGAAYHPNADALAAVFDCDALHEVDRGPTIGGALLYTREERVPGAEPRRDWLLVQEGGLPGALEPLLGVFRSPLWAARNRHRDIPEELLRRTQRPPAARLPFESVTDLFAGLTRGALHSQLQGIHGPLLASLGRTPEEWPMEDRHLRRWRLVPDQLRAALATQKDELLERLGDAAEPFVSEFLEQTAKRIGNEHDVEKLLKRSPLPVDRAGLGDGDLFRRGLELGVQLLWGSEAELVRKLSNQLLGALVPETSELARRVADGLRWALDYRLGDGHTALLLCMGRDAKPGELALADSGPAPRPLRARLPAPSELPERRVEEQLLRDLAGVDGWRGELRTDPAWTFLDRRITVHSQGGCPMGRVTAADGQVAGCPGLYVMDAAAFPRPVGVNPSATIAAIAEYKVERFLRETGHDSSWRAAEMERARAWADARREQLDPIAALAVAESSPPRQQPIGIRFHEVMKGFHADPGPEPHGVRQFRLDELRGIETAGTIELRLDAEISDLARFLELHRRGMRPRAALDGCIALSGLPGIGACEATLCACRGDGGENHLELFSEDPSHPKDARNLRYRVHFHLDGMPYFLEGLKFIRDEAGFDVWEDTTRLFFELSRGTPPAVFRRGILRTPASEFFGTQLPSFEATNTLDPARRSWALAAFGRFFFGNILEVYVPELDRLGQVVKSIAERTHA